MTKNTEIDTTEQEDIVRKIRGLIDDLRIEKHGYKFIRDILREIVEKCSITIDEIYDIEEGEEYCMREFNLYENGEENELVWFLIKRPLVKDYLIEHLETNKVNGISKVEQDEVISLLRR